MCIGGLVDADLVEAVVAAITGAVGDGSLPLARLEDAAARCTALAAWTASSPSSVRTPADLGYVVARRAVRVEGSLDGFGTPLLVHLNSGFSIAEGAVPWGLGPHANGTEQVRVDPATASAEELVARAAGRPIVIVGRHHHRLPATRALIEQLAATHAVAVVEMGWPSPWRPAGARAFVITFGASRANGRATAAALGLAGD
jgi:beta-N-acetylhexosaminidase